MQKVLIVASYADSILRFRGKLIEDLVSRGIEVHIAAPGLSSDPLTFSPAVEGRVIQHDIPFRRANVSVVADILVLSRLTRLIRSTNPDCCVTYTVKPNIYGAIAGWLCCVPMRVAMVTGAGYVFTGARKGLLVSIVRSLYRFALHRVHLIFFQNPDDLYLFRDMGCLDNNTRAVVVNGSGVDISEFSFSQTRPKEIVFTLIGRLLGDKGIREYAAAAEQIVSEYDNVTFKLVGWIDENPDAISQNEVNSWLESGCIEYLGFISDVRQVLSETSVYVLPSYREGTPRTVLEAMSMGRPIITTDVPGCRETVIDGENGYLVPARSAGDLVKVMRRFIEDPSLVESMGARSRQIAVERYDVHKVNAVMLKEMGVA